MLLVTLGKRLRNRRLELNLSQVSVSKKAGVSLRFLSDVEQGKSNISVLRLAEICAALQYPVAELLRGIGANGPQMLALVGMRGAGKSTLGNALSSHLGIQFVELDQLIEQESGMTLTMLFKKGGGDLYRQWESQTLQKLFQSGRPTILSTGGSLVSDVHNWTLLRGYARTVWLRCAPEIYLQRVKLQHDLRPMKGFENALSELQNLLQSRESLYAQADKILDTDQHSIDELVRELAQFFVDE